jgi:hypothetical protein
MFCAITPVLNAKATAVVIAAMLSLFILFLVMLNLNDV